MTQPNTRPEDRRRSGVDSLAHQGWADTRPGCFRSEGFAEDLQEAEEACRSIGRQAQGVTAAPVSWTLFGVALAGMLGVFGR